MADEKENINLSVNGVQLTVEKETFSKALEEGELIITNDDVEVRTASDFKEYITNKTGDRYEAGKEVGEKRALEGVLPEYKISLEEQSKTVKNFAIALKTQLSEEFEARYKDQLKDPTTKVKELTTDLESLREINQDWENKFNGLIEQNKQNDKKQKISNTMLTGIIKHKGEAESIINNSEMSLIFSNKLTPSMNGEDVIEYHDEYGKVLKEEKTLKLKDIDSILPDLMSPYLKKVEGGEGGEDSKNVTKGSYEAYERDMAAKGWNLNGVNAKKELQKRIDEKTIEL